MSEVCDVKEAAASVRLEEYEKLKDPFRNITEELSLWNKLKFIFPGLLVLPLRVAGTVFWLSAAMVFASVAQIGLRKPKKGEAAKPLTGWRRAMASMPNWFARGLLFNLGFHRIRVKGRPDPRATVVVANHTGPWEALALMYYSGCCFLSRAENARAPLIGPTLRATQALFVDRDSATSREKTIAGIQERACAPIGRWPPLCIFPEGTTINGSSFIGFRTGAFQPGVPVQPVIVRHHFKHLDVSWSGCHLSMGTLLLRIMTQWNNTMTLEYLPLYTPTEAERAAPQLYAENVRAAMSRASGIPVSRYSIDDYYVLMEASKLGIDQSEALLGMEVLRKESHLSVTDIKDIMRSFHQMDAASEGKITFESFIASLKIPDTKVSRSVFEDLAKAEGGLSFRNFLKGIVHISRNVTTGDKIQQCFDIVNISGNGQLTLEEMAALFEFAAPDMQLGRAKEIFQQMDKRKVGFVDVIAFGTFLRDHPMYMTLFEASRDAERSKDPDNPVVRCIQLRAAGTPMTVALFREMVQKYRDEAASRIHAEQSAVSF